MNDRKREITLQQKHNQSSVKENNKDKAVKPMDVGSGTDQGSEAGSGTDQGSAAETGLGTHRGSDINHAAATDLDGESQAWYASSYGKVGITVFATFVACALFFFMLLRYKGLMNTLGSFVKSGQPIIFGFVLAYLLNPVMKFIERYVYRFLKDRSKSEQKAKKNARTIAVLGSVLFLILIVGLLIAAVVPAVISSVTSLVDTLPGYVQSFTRLLQRSDFGNTEVTKYVTLALTNVTEFVEEWATTKLLPEAQTYVTQITTSVIALLKSILNFVIGIIVAIYLLSSKETFTGQSKKILYAVFKPKNANLILEIARKSDEIFGGFITGKLLDSAIIGVICYVGCSILRMPNAVLIATIIGITNIIPFFGPIIGAVPCLLLVVVQSPIHALYLLIFILVLQQVDGNIIGPKILGDSTGLSSFWVMFAILIFGGKFGFMGMLLGVPVMGVIYYIITRIVNYGVRCRGLSDETSDYVTLDNVDISTNQAVYMEAGQVEKKKIKRKAAKK